MYYKLNKDFYRRSYYENVDFSRNIDYSSLCKLNGFHTFPQYEYSIILNAIQQLNFNIKKVIDFGCGTGLLLDYIVKRYKTPLSPYGIDFLEESIFLAKQLFAKFEDNFILANAAYIESINLNFRDSIILLDPYHYKKTDLIRMITYIKRFESPILLYTYSDVLNSTEIGSIEFFISGLDIPLLYNYKHELIQIIVI